MEFRFCECGEKFKQSGILEGSEDLRGERREVGEVKLPFSTEEMRFTQHIQRLSYFEIFGFKMLEYLILEI
ncbi:MAG: hypothetical protein GTN74_17535 [Proteobacteria bacterium]|nr:hypothetical protein [Pseudomonadota bacterium]